MSKKNGNAEGSKKVVKRYDWDNLFDGKDHVLTQGEDFTGTVRAAAAMVRYRARQRGVQVTAEVASETTIKVTAGDPAGAPRGRKKEKAS